MQQTLLALLALLLAMLLTVQHQRRAAREHLMALRAEVGVMATGIAVDRLDEVSMLAFDENTRLEATVASAAGLTAPAGFGAGLDTPSDDVDDMHAVMVDTARVMGADTLWFRIHTAVTYADPADPDAATTTRTKFKRVSVRVYNTNLAPAFVDTVRLAQSVACGSACTW